jgi:S-adenosylmethionine:tRNA ribosyltransferase-isomerase
LVFNDSKVIPGRIHGSSESGGKVEFLLLNRIDDCSWSALVSKRKKQKIGRRYTFAEGVIGEITDFTEEGRIVTFDRPVDVPYLERHGSVPLPPYIKRDPEPADRRRYQTIYAREYGSAAAPTAGLHFTEELLDELRRRGVVTASVTLHVGIGTFLPIRSPEVEEHVMHRERYRISPEAADTINDRRKKGGKVVAVGTTSVRTLESAFKDGRIIPGEGSTELYIYPGYRFEAVDGMLTNFHTPESSLLVMVSAFAGIDTIKGAYREAVRREYRFFSYGDAMFLAGRGSRAAGRDEGTQ